MARTTLLTLGLVLLTPTLALAAGGGEHHGGELSLGAVLHNAEFWAAVLNFGLLIFVLVKFSKAPMGKLLEERSRAVEENIAEASALKAKAQGVLDEYTERLKTLDKELEKLKADIARAAEEDKARVLAQAEEAAARMKRETEALVQRQGEHLEREVKREVVRAAVQAAEEELRKALTNDDQQRLAQDFQQQLRAGGGS